jgi:predicted permease
LRNVHAINLGYDVDQLMVATVMFDAGDDVPADLRSGLVDEADRLSTVPGVEAAGVSSMPPMGGLFFARVFLPSGDTAGKGLQSITWNAVSPGFFAASGMRLKAGRDFRTSNGEGAERVMIVNESMAKTVWPGQPALGQCLMLGRSSDPCVAVIGVVSDSHLEDLMESAPMHYFLPLAQMPERAASGSRSAAITVRADGARRASVAQLIQHDLRQRFPPSANVTVDDFEKQLAPRYSQWRQGAVLFSLLGAVALVLTIVGVFSVIAYMVSQRTHEMGVRIALGARGGDIVRLVVQEGLRVVAVGVGLGVGLALALGRLVASLLYDISPYDPGVLIGASLVLAGAAMVACVVPAARAMRVDPIGALRVE